MTRPYFRQIPDFEYISRIKGEEKISDYVQVKNLFRRGKLREDIFRNLTFFEKYSIIGDERPDTIAFKLYGDETLDWVILLSNNIINIYEEWPMTQFSFDKVMIEKYKTYDNLYGKIHHYETIEVKNSYGNIVLPSGLNVESDFVLEYYEDEKIITNNNAIIPITNYQYEIKKEDEKRNIFYIKGKYLNIIFNDIENIMEYKKGGTQYISPTLKRGDNIRLFD
jgi:hypothetical protein